MPEPKPPKPKPPHPGALIGRIRALVKQGAFSWGTHVFERSAQRNIDIHDATEVLRLGEIEVLRLGEIEGPIEPGVNPGEWKCKVTAKPDKSSRRLGVAVVVVRDERLFLLTVEWEDTK
jgi:hypothetical protein